MTQSYGMRSNFCCRSKMRNNELKEFLLRYGVKKIRSARITTNFPILMRPAWDCELKYSDLGEGNVKRKSCILQTFRGIRGDVNKALDQLWY